MIGVSSGLLDVGSSRSARARRRFAARPRTLLKRYPDLSGVDLDWEYPNGEPQWRDFAKLAKELRR